MKIEKERQCKKQNKVNCLEAIELSLYTSTNFLFYSFFFLLFTVYPLTPTLDVSSFFLFSFWFSIFFSSLLIFSWAFYRPPWELSLSAGVSNVMEWNGLGKSIISTTRLYCLWWLFKCSYRPKQIKQRTYVLLHLKTCFKLCKSANSIASTVDDFMAQILFLSSFSTLKLCKNFQV